MLAVFTCFSVLLGLSLGSPSSNQYLDSVIHTTLQNVIKNEKIDPSLLPDYSYDYYDKILFKKVHGRVDYSEGQVRGLSEVVRASECQGPTNSSGNTVTSIFCTLSLTNLKTSYKGRVKYGVLPKVTIDAEADVSPVQVAVEVVKAVNENNPRIKSFTLRQGAQLSTRFSGLGPLNGQMKVLEENYRNRVAIEVNYVVVNRFQYALNLAVNQVPMPLR